MLSGCLCDVLGLITVAGFDRCERWATLWGGLCGRLGLIMVVSADRYEGGCAFWVSV